jgi:hypothetical protein
MIKERQYAPLRIHQKIALAFLLTAVAVPTRGQTGDEALATSQWHDAFQLTATTRSVARPFVVDNTAAFSVYVIAASQTLTVKLISPAGAIYTIGDATTAVFQGSISLIASTTTKPGASYLATITKPVPGKWTLNVSDSVTPVAPMNVVATIFLNNATRIVLVGGGNSYPSGSNVRLALVAFDGAARLSGLAIKARLFRPFDPTFTTTAVTFRDDGGGADQSPNDRIYEAFVNPGQAGTYQVQIDVSGASSTGTFQRSAATLLRVVESKAQIMSFTDQGIDDNSDGLVDRITVKPAATLSTAGTYSISVRLRASNGRELVENVEQTLGVGIVSPAVTFSAEEINANLGVDGPFTVAEVRWYQIVNDDLVPAGFRSELGLTHAYPLSQMQHPRLRLNAAGDAAGVDLHGTGTFEFLDIHLGITADFAGAYSYSASLVDRNGHEIDFVSSSASLVVGTNKLPFRFRGILINENHVDGPYLLSNLIVTGVGQALLQTTGFTTSEFKASAFVSPRRRPSVPH